MVSAKQARAVAASLRSPELVVIPVRHHSPACARHVDAVMGQTVPFRVLIEGPADCTHLMAEITAADAELPLAIYSYQPGQGTYYPLAEFSPEYRAMLGAQHHGVRPEFIDLPAHVQHCDDGADSGAATPTSPGALEATLAALAGPLRCQDSDDVWDHLIESPFSVDDLTAHVERVATYCLLARADSTAASCERDGTAARERAMTAAVWAALADRQRLVQAGTEVGPVVVVQGGFHAVALPEQLTRSAYQTPAPLPVAPAKSGAALVRYSYAHISALSSYQAGITAPAWQERIYRDANDRDRLVLAVLQDTARALAPGQLISTPMVQAAYTHAKLLAALRDRTVPLRTDVVDAVTNCFIQGDVDTAGTLVVAALADVLEADRIGVVPQCAVRAPLVTDALRVLAEHRYPVDQSKPKRFTLDIYRNQKHRATSQVFHRLNYLGAQVAHLESGPDFVRGVGLHKIREIWQARWHPGVESGLTAAAQYGQTVDEAVRARFCGQVAELNALDNESVTTHTTSLVAQGCLLGLADCTAELLDHAPGAIARDSDFVRVVQAATTWLSLWESREPLAAKNLTVIPDLLVATFRRAVFLLDAALTAGDWSDVVAAMGDLVRIAEATAADGASYVDAEPLWENVVAVAASHPHLSVRGGAVGLAYAAGRLTDEDLAAVLVADVEWFSGLLTTCRELTWMSPVVRGALRRMVSGWDAAEFAEHLPAVRLAFTYLIPREIDRFSAALSADLHAPADLHPPADPPAADPPSVEPPVDGAAGQVPVPVGAAARAEGVEQVLREAGLAGWFQP